MAQYPQYSIVIPAYNERARILATLEAAVEAVRARISYLRDGLQMLKELAIVRWNALSGRYRRKTQVIARAGESS